MRLLIISTSMSAQSLSRELARQVSGELSGRGVTVDWVDLREFPPVLADDRAIEEYPPEYGDLWVRLEEAHGVVVAMPVYSSSTSGPCKNLVDIVGGALQGKPMAVLSAAGSPRGFLAVRDLMATLIFECGVYVYPRTIQVTDEEDPSVAERVPQFAEGFMTMVRALTGAK